MCNTYSSALIKAEEIKVQTVSVPNMGTGVYNFPKQLAAEIAIGTILSELPFYNEVKEVFFVCYDIVNYEIYKGILENIDDPKIEILI